MNYSNSHFVIINPPGIEMIHVKNEDCDLWVPLDPANNDYINIMQLVEEGKLTIQPAEDINNQNS